MDKIEIILNGEKNQVPPTWSIADLVRGLRLPGQQVAVEVNEEIVDRDHWKDRALHPGDAVEIVHFVGGGDGPCLTI